MNKQNTIPFPKKKNKGFPIRIGQKIIFITMIN